MQLIEVIKLVAELGFLTTAAGYFVYRRIRQDKRVDAKQDSTDEAYQEVLNKIQAQNDRLVEKIVSGVAKHTITGEENNYTTVIERELNKTIKQVMTETKASRACLVRFHNGGRDMSGLSFLKMSMTNEFIQMGEKPLLKDFQNMFRSFLVGYLDDLDKDEALLSDNIDNFKTLYPVLYEFMEDRGMHAGYSIAVRNNDGIMIGFLALEFRDSRKRDKVKIQKVLKSLQLKVETLLNIN